MKAKFELEKGLYFVHGSYTSSYNEWNKNKVRDRMILMKDSIDDIYDIDAYDINTREVDIQSQQMSQGEFVYYTGESFKSAEDNPTSVMYEELNRQLIRTIGYDNYGNQPETTSDTISNVYSYHINVGHGNCSLIVFSDSEKYNIWMIDCSVFDFTDKHNYFSNLKVCMDDINKKFGVTKVSKLLITHLHYDHINGIECLITNGWIDGSTEVWMNIQYPWKQPTYNRILLQLKALGVKFIDPIVSNSTQHINVLYPDISFNDKNVAPKNNINNASVLYQICLGGNSMLFTGDMETEGWENVRLCCPLLNKSTYYCISHHGSITGHLRSKCVDPANVIETLADCANLTEIQVLMGRNRAYKGVFSSKVLSDYPNILKTEDAEHYLEVEWSRGKHAYV